MSQTTHANAGHRSNGPQELLAGPVIPSIIKLALPTVVVLLVQTFVGVAETYFVSFLGTAALAGVTLVFPVLMLMQMMSNGGIGGGTAAAVARALGGGRQEDADALVWHALVVACGFGILFMVTALIFASSLYEAMGGADDALRAALTYSNVVFAGSVLIWITALLSSALRGAGNPKTPALVIVSGTFILLPLSPLLIFGWGPIPALGVAGGGVAILVYYLFATVALILRLRSGRDAIRLKVVKLEGRLFREILGVGILSAIGTIQVNLTVVFVTAAVGKFGVDALAGYGIASRLDYLQIPVLFGIGTAIVTLVGLNIGAGQVARARRIAWSGAALAFALSSIVGVYAAVWPSTWMELFSNSPDVVAEGSHYLRTVAPFYPLVAFGLALYFASQGARRVLIPVLAGTVRMIIAAFIGFAAVQIGTVDSSTLYAIVALSSIVYGVISGASVYLTKWHSDERRTRPRTLQAPT